MPSSEQQIWLKKIFDLGHQAALLMEVDDGSKIQ